MSENLKRRKTFVLYKSIFLILLSFSISAQSNKSYLEYSKKDGLPSNIVYCITSDKNGFLWIGTDAGLVKFDGFVRRVYTIRDGLPSNDIFEIICDYSNRLWLTTIKSELCYIENDSVFTKKNSTLLKGVEIKNVLPKYFQDSDSSIWISTTPFNIFRLKRNKLSKIEHTAKIVNAQNITEYNKSIYFIGNEFVLRYDLRKETFETLKNKNAYWSEGVSIIGDTVYYINKDNLISKNHISLFLSGGLISISNRWKLPLVDSSFWLLSQKGYKRISPYNLKEIDVYLPKENVSHFHKAPNGDYWFATLDRGIFKLESDCSRKITETGLNEDIISTVVFLTKNSIFIGTNGGEILVYNRSSLSHIKSIEIKTSSLSNFRILKIQEYDEHLIAATDVGMFQINKINHSIKKLNLWHGALKHFILENDSLTLLDNDGLRFYNYNDIKKRDSIICYKRFYSYTKYLNQKIVGSQDSLYSFDKELKYYPLNIPFHYRAMDLDVQDSLLVATTAEKGIFIIKGHTVLKNLTTDNGMVSNTCNRSVIYKNYVYTATNHGIHIYSLKNDSLSYLFESDGLPSNNINDIAVDQDTIFAATEEGLSIIPLSALKYRPPFPCFAQPVITYQDTLWNKPDSVSTRTDKLLLVKVNALSYTSKIPLRFFYRIKEIDSNFKETREQNLELRFPHPGYFTLEVHALNGDFQKSQVLRMHVFVQPYFYQTTWFKLLIVLLVVLILLGTYLILLKAARRRAQIKHETENKMRNLELSAWRSTVNPHFLFNALNTMQGLFHNNDFEAVNQFIIEFSSVLRKTIDQSGRIMISIQEEVNYLKNYLEFEKVKRHGILDFDIQWDDDKILKWYIPSMLIQPVLENSLKHGIRQNGLGELHVSFFLLDDKIRCVLHDNGDGFKEDDLNGENSKGLRLITDKIAIVEKLLKKNINFSFQNRKNTRGEIIGTETIFLFPIITNIRQFPDIESQFKDPDPKV
jgi:ligand-binding sensor domain-containing protein